MTRELTEADVLSEIFTPSQYQDFAMQVYQEMVNSNVFKRDDPIVFSIRNYEVSEKLFLHIEATLKKLDNGVHDFGFVRFVLTDDFDFTLDRWNEAKRNMNS